MQTVTAANESVRKTLGELTVAITEKDREIDRLAKSPCNTDERSQEVPNDNANIGGDWTRSGCLLFAAEQPKEKVQVSKTERIDFPAGGTLRFTNSIGVLTVEAWDRPDVEITTIKSTKEEYDASEREKATHELEKVNVVAERHGDELVITTTFPRYRTFPITYPLLGEPTWIWSTTSRRPAPPSSLSITTSAM